MFQTITFVLDIVCDFPTAVRCSPRDLSGDMTSYSVQISTGSIVIDKVRGVVMASLRTLDRCLYFSHRNRQVDHALGILDIVYYRSGTVLTFGII
jgi:hypothetical protein